MGSGFKDWSPGDVLTAADVDGYLMRQTVMTFADASARDTALSGVLDEGMVAYLEDTNAITVYNGSAWVSVIDSDVLTVDTANNRVGINDSTPSHALDVTGDINATGDLRIGGDAIGDWTAYTPTVTNLTLGTGGAASGRYAVVNNIAVLEITFTLGTGGAATGLIQLGVPAGLTPASSNFWGRAVSRPTGAGSFYFHTIQAATAGSVYIYADNSSSTYVTLSGTSASVPATWANTGSLQGSIVYEVA
jgi:hypothetical protein